MASIDNPQPWPPYESTRDCSQGFCSPYCPQWCYIVFPPPPPLGFPLDDSSDPNFSPLVIAIIGILASAFLLVSYYTVVSKYCGNFNSLRRRSHGDSGQEQDGTRTPAGQEAWQIAPTGLDESLIRTITVCKYKKGDGLVEGTDCSVCLNEFQDEESLRLLPKCSHAFHVSCIDTWLKSHSNCPLCRAHIVSPTPLPLQLPPPAEQQTSPDQRALTDSQRDDDSVVAVASEDLETSREELNLGNGGAESKPPVRALSNLEGRYHIVEIREKAIQPIRRSISLDYSRESPLSVADVLDMSMEDELDAKDLWFAGGSSAESSKRSGVEESKGNSRSRVLHSVLSPVAMKRCSSSGRFLFTRQGRGRNSVLPL